MGLSVAPIRSAEREASGLFASDKKRALLVTLALFAAVLGLYNSATYAHFTNYDDQYYILENYQVQRGLTLHNIRWAFTSFAVTNWHPVTWLSHELDCQLFGLNPAGHHLTSVVLHACNVALLFGLLWAATRRIWRSFWVAALFAVHPLNVESVAWIAERKNVLSTFFLLLTLAAYGWYALKPGWKRYITVVIVFSLGLMSKPMLVTLPFALLLIDFWPLYRFQGHGEQRWPVVPVRKLLIEKIPLLVLAVASSVVTLIAQRAGGAVKSVQLIPLHARFENALLAYAAYISKLFWPVRLTAFYPYDLQALQWRAVAASAILLIFVTAVVIRLRHKRYLLVGWLWFLGTMVPVIGLVQVGDQAMADRYAYVPLLGLFLMLAWGIADVSSVRRWLQTAAVGLAVVSIVGLGALTLSQISYWHDGITLFSHALQVTRSNFIAEDNLGQALALTGREEEAVTHFRAALAIDSRDPLAHFNLGTYFFIKSQPQAALSEYARVFPASNDPELLSRTHHNSAIAWSELGNRSEAESEYRLAIAQGPDFFKSYSGLALLLLNEGRAAEAIPLFKKSLEILPTTLAYYNLGRAYENVGRFGDAADAYQEALKLDPHIEDGPQRLQHALELKNLSSGSGSR